MIALALPGDRLSLLLLGAHPEIGADATLLSTMDRGVSSSTPLVHAVQATAKTNSRPRQQN